MTNWARLGPIYLEGPHTEAVSKVPIALGSTWVVVDALSWNLPCQSFVRREQQAEHCHWVALPPSLLPLGLIGLELVTLEAVSSDASAGCLTYSSL